MLGAEVDDVRRSETGADNPIALWRERETAQRNIEHAIDGIRGIEGLEGFLASPTWRSITGAIVSEAPLVYLAATFFGGVALIVTGDRSDSTPVQAVQLDELTGAAVGDLMTAGSSGMSADPWLTAYMDWQENNDEASDARWLTTVDQVTRRLWDLALGPVTETLSASGFDEAVLVPIGLLGLLPLHAAWRPEPSAVTGRRAVVDYLAVSYAPSARAMREAQQREREISQLQLLAVAEPSPSSGGELPHARQEVNAIASLFEQPKVLSGAEASRTAFLEALPAANVAHFACHARANQVVPLESAILMAGDEPLTVRDMMSRRPMTARLAVLSACETAAIGIQLLDEVVGLPAALLQAGFVGVVASLWPVEDAATALLMQRFYTGWKVEGDSPRRALRKAQVGLRDVRGGEFAHPFWWSAFTVVGV